MTSTNKNHGYFVFKGIAPSDVKGKSVPNDIIPPDPENSKTITPLTHIALYKGKNFNSSDDDSRISIGILPEGLNRIGLVIIIKGEQIKKYYLL